MYCSSSSINILIEETTFTECHTTSYSGGAIYFNVVGNCCLVKVCGYKCSTLSDFYYQFDYIRVPDSDSNINTVNDSSIAYSYNSNIDAWYTMRHDYGRFISCAVNVSNNYCSRYSAIECCRCYTSLISFSSFANNTCHTYYTCLRFVDSNADNEIRTSNVIRNKQSSSSYGTIYSSSSNLFIKDSCIVSNEANRDFYAYSCTITITK